MTSRLLMDKSNDIWGVYKGITPVLRFSWWPISTTRNSRDWLTQFLMHLLTDCTIQRHRTRLAWPAQFIIIASYLVEHRKGQSLDYLVRRYKETLTLTSQFLDFATRLTNRWSGFIVRIATEWSLKATLSLTNPTRKKNIWGNLRQFWNILKEVILRRLR